MNKHRNYRQPYFVQALFGGVLLLLNKRLFRKKGIPHQIDQYRLITEYFKADASDRNYTIGVYSDGRKKYFIKTWEGKFKDSNYYNLLNEYLINETIYSHLENAKDLSRVTTPRVVSLIENTNSLSVVFEFIEGTMLTAFPIGYQVEILSLILESFESISHELKKEHRGFFVHRGGLSYLLSLPIVAFIAILKYPRSVGAILRSSLLCIRSFFYSYPLALTLAHRDIGPDNVIVAEGGFYVVDFERMALTYPLYDITSLGVEPDYTEIVSAMKENFIYVEDEFLRLFIALRRTAFSGRLYV